MTKFHNIIIEGGEDNSKIKLKSRNVKYNINNNKKKQKTTTK
jgi:hypothetical protein